MSKQPTQPTALEATPPVLSLFRAGPLAVLRIHDLAFSDVVSAVVRSLPADVASLMLVTPTDTKMFNLSNGKASYANSQGRTTDAGAEGETSGELADAGTAAGAGADEDLSDPQAEAVRLAEAAEAAETPAARRKALREIRRAAELPAGDPCRRCNGSGQIAIALESGSSTTAACGVCKGAGVIKRFGERRTR